LWLTHRYGRGFVDSLLPLIKATILFLDDHYKIVGISTGTEGPDTVVRLRVTQVHAIFLGGRVSMPDSRGWAEVTTTIGTVVQPLIIAGGLILAWPFNRWKELGLRLLIGGGVLMCVFLIDTPFTLWAYVWDMHVRSYEPTLISPLLIWHKFLINGGRQALGMGTGVVVIAVANRVSSFRHIGKVP